MITKEDLVQNGLSEEVATTAIEQLGDVAKKLSTENLTKKAYDSIDLSVLSDTQIAKNEGEKTSDYKKRAYAAFYGNKEKESVTNATKELNEQIRIAKEELKNHKGDETLKAKLEALETEKATFLENKEKAIGEKDKEINKLKGEFDSYKKTSDLRLCMPGKFKDGLSDKYLKFEKDQAIEKALVDFDKVEEKDGETFLINSESFDRVKAKDFFAEQLKDVIHSDVEQGGAGSGKGGSGSGKGTLQLSDSMTSAEKETKIKDHVLASGIGKMDDEYVPTVRKLKIEHGLIKAEKE